MESSKSYAVLAAVAALGLVACGKPDNTARPQADASTTTGAVNAVAADCRRAITSSYGL
jgi:putative hemolysin